MPDAAQSVYDEEVLRLQDDSELLVRTLPIKRLRTANKMLGALGDDLTEREVEAGLDVGEASTERLLDVAAFAVSARKPEVWNSSTRTHTEEAEDLFDVPTILRIIKVATGVDLSKVMEMAAMVEAAQEETE